MKVIMFNYPVRIMVDKSGLDSSYSDEAKLVVNNQFSIKGNVISYYNKNITIKTTDSELPYILPFKSISKVEFNSKKGSYFTHGAIAGGIIGCAVAVAVISSNSNTGGSAQTDVYSGPNFDVDFLEVVGTIAGIGVCTALGGWIGQQFKVEKWEEIPLDRFRGGFKPPGRYYPIMRFQFPLRK